MRTTINDIYRDFNYITLSHQSNELLSCIAKDVQETGIKSNNNKLIDALCTLNVALMRAAIKGPVIYAYRSMGAGSFSKEIVGFRPFSHAVNGMKALGLIERKEGQDRSNAHQQRAVYIAHCVSPSTAICSSYVLMCRKGDSCDGRKNRGYPG